MATNIHGSQTYNHPFTPSNDLSSLDSNSTNPSGGGYSCTTRSIHLPTNHSNQFMPHSPLQVSDPWNKNDTKHKQLSDSMFQLHPSPIPPPSSLTHTSTIKSPPSSFQSNLTSLLAQQLHQVGLKELSSPSSGGTTLPTLTRHESVPSSCGSTISTFSSGTHSPIHSSGQVSPIHDQELAHPFALSDSSMTTTGSHSPLPTPDPISLWYGCEDTPHARAVLATYSEQLIEKRASNSRAPVEFIGRVKREKLDVAKLHRLIHQHRTLSHASSAPRQRYASAADGHSGSTYENRNKSFSSTPCLTKFSSYTCQNGRNGDISLSSSPSQTDDNSIPSPLDTLPTLGSFTTLDLVSIYSRDTLPLGLVFPLVKHEWVWTSWNIEDGVQERSGKIRTEFDGDDEIQQQATDEETEEETPEEKESKQILQLYIRSILKPKKLSVKCSSITTASSDQHQPLSSTTTSTSSNTSICSSSSNNTATAPSSTLWQTASAPHTHICPPEPPVTTSFLYNLPIFSEDCTSGCFDTFGCKVVRPLGERAQLGPKKKLKLTKQLSSSNTESTSTSSQLPSSLGYSGSQNDCVYNCLRVIGLKTKCNRNPGLSTGDDCVLGEAGAGQTIINHEQQLNARATAYWSTTPQNEETKEEEEEEPSNTNMTTPTSTTDEQTDDEDGESSSSSDPGDSSSDEDEVDQEDEVDDLNDLGDDDDTAAVGGFEFGVDEDDDDGEDALAHNTRTLSASKAVAIKKSPTRPSAHPPARHSPTDSDSDDDDHGHFQQHSFSHHSTVGSLGDELQAQLMALNGGRKK